MSSCWGQHQPNRRKQHQPDRRYTQHSPPSDRIIAGRRPLCNPSTPRRESVKASQDRSAQVATDLRRDRMIALARPPPRGARPGQSSQLGSGRCPLHAAQNDLVSNGCQPDLSVQGNRSRGRLLPRFLVGGGADLVERAFTPSTSKMRGSRHQCRSFGVGNVCLSGGLLI